MIERVIVKNYRKFQRLDFKPSAGMNIIVGDNDAGKSTLLEAIGMALTGRVNGRWAGDEKNPFWFNRDLVQTFFEAYGSLDQVAPPEILIELYFPQDVADPDLQRMRGVHNSISEAGTKTDCPGVRLQLIPAVEYKEEFRQYMEDPPAGILPIEYYDCRWSDFDGKPLLRRPKSLATAFIDSRTLRATSGLDYHTRQILDSFLEDRDRVRVAIEHRRSRHELTSGVLAEVTERMRSEEHGLQEDDLGLAMDQSARAAWEGDVVPHVGDIPFGMSGHGRQAAVKVKLAMHRGADRVKYLLVEEPENHQSHTSLQALLSAMQVAAGAEQQVFVSTHSSFVLNRLGLDRLHLLQGAKVTQISELSTGTVKYFQHLAGYDTLRLVLSRRLVLVEGPSDEMVFRRCYSDTHDRTPEADRVDVVSMSGITFKRALELCALLEREAVALQDNDGTSPTELLEDEDLKKHLSDTRKMFIGEPSLGHTLEPQLIAANGLERMREVLELRAQDDPTTWMRNHKTESALRIITSGETIVFPQYIVDAVEYFA